MRLSIVLINYNYAHYLRFCIDSILSQSYRDYELIIVDDGSNDDSPAIIESYQDPRIKKILCPQNQGITKAVMEGFRVATGEFIHPFASDDAYRPGFLAKVIEHLDKNPFLDLLCTDFAYINEHNELFEEKKLLSCKEPAVFTPEKIMSVYRSSQFWVPGPSCLFRREKILKTYGWYDCNLENISDWFLYQKIALFEGVGYIPETLVAMRVHGQTYTSRIKRDKKRRRATYKHLLKKLLKEPEAKKRFLKAGLLDFIFKELYYRTLFNPRFLAYAPYLLTLDRHHTGHFLPHKDRDESGEDGL